LDFFVSVTFERIKIDLHDGIKIDLHDGIVTVCYDDGFVL